MCAAVQLCKARLLQCTREHKVQATSAALRHAEELGCEELAEAYESGTVLTRVLNRSEGALCTP